MHCEKYHADMPESTCVARQNITAKDAMYYGRARDPGCIDCDQGKDILKRYGAEGKGESMGEPTKSCTQCDRPPQPLTEFYKDGKDNVCKSCRRNWQKEYAASKKGGKPKRAPRKKPAQDEKPLSDPAEGTAADRPPLVDVITKAAENLADQLLNAKKGSGTGGRKTVARIIIEVQI